MKRLLAIMSASLLASAAIVGSAVAQGASENAPGKLKIEGESAQELAPGQQKEEGESARTLAPGQIMNEERSDAADDDVIPDDDDVAVDEDLVDDETTASVDGNFGTVISSIRAGKSDLSGVTEDTEVEIVEVDDLIQGNNRVALDNALSDNESQITELRDELRELGHLDLETADVDSAVAARMEADGRLTLYVDRED